jgi:LysM repeat protein
MSEFRFSGYAKSWQGGSNAYFKQLLTDNLLLKDLGINYVNVTLTAQDNQDFFGHKFAVSLSVLADETQATVVSNVTAAIGRTFGNLTGTNEVVLTGVFGTTAPTTQPTASGTTYTVKSGDTLTKIAIKFGTTVQALAALNSISNVNVLKVGQVLRITAGAVNTGTTNTTNTPVIIPNTNPTYTPVIYPANNPQPQANQNWLDPFYKDKKLTSLGVAGLILVAGLVIVSKK